MKRFLTLLLALSMMVGVFAGCGGNDSSSTASTASTAGDASTASTAGDDEIEIVNGTYVTGLPIAAEDITLNILVERHTLDQTKSYSEKAAFKNVKEETGIDIEWTELAAGTASEKVPLMLAGGDLPDVFYGNILGNATIMQNEESFVPLEDLMEKYAPNCLATYDQITSVDWREYATTTTGHIYGFLTRYNSLKENRVNGIQIINKKWLDEVGMDVPTTTEEFYEVLKAFKGHDFNGNGVDDEIPFAPCDNMWCAQVDNAMGWWGIGQGQGSYYQVHNDTVEPILNTNEYREFLEYFHKLYAEGLINAEFASDSVEAFSTKIKEGKVGSYYSWTALEYLSSDVAQDWVTVPTLRAYDDVAPVANGSVDAPTINRNQYVITTACEHPEAAVRLWDHWARDTESKLTVMLGEKGQLWDQYEDGGYYFQVPTNTTEEFTFEHAKYTYGTVNHGPLLTEAETPVNDPTISPDAALRDEMVDVVIGDCVAKEDQMPIYYTSTEANERLSFISTDLDSYVAEARSQFIINGVTDADWDAYVQRLQDLRYDEYIQWYQDFHDGTLE